MSQRKLRGVAGEVGGSSGDEVAEGDNCVKGGGEGDLAVVLGCGGSRAEKDFALTKSRTSRRLGLNRNRR